MSGSHRVHGLSDGAFHTSTAFLFLFEGHGLSSLTSLFEHFNSWSWRNRQMTTVFLPTRAFFTS
jgi:hypothetical protein